MLTCFCKSSWSKQDDLQKHVGFLFVLPDINTFLPKVHHRWEQWHGKMVCCRQGPWIDFQRRWRRVRFSSIAGMDIRPFPKGSLGCLLTGSTAFYEFLNQDLMFVIPVDIFCIRNDFFIIQDGFLLPKCKANQEFSSMKPLSG